MEWTGWNRKVILTQCPGSCNLTEGSCAHFIVGENAELIVGVRGEARHQQPGSSRRRDWHREPVPLSTMITRWNLLHPAEGERERDAERGSENKEQRETPRVWLYGIWQKSRFHSSFMLIISFRVCDRPLMYSCNCTESSRLQLRRFSCSYWGWNSTHSFHTEQIIWPKAREIYPLTGIGRNFENY